MYLDICTSATYVGIFAMYHSDIYLFHVSRYLCSISRYPCYVLYNVYYVFNVSRYMCVICIDIYARYLGVYICIFVYLDIGICRLFSVQAYIGF